MIYKQSYIKSMAVAMPPKFLSSDEFEQQLAPLFERLKLPFGRTQLQTGIETRGLWDNGTLPSDVAYEAASQIINEKNRSKIDLMIYSGVCRNVLEPSTASFVHAKLGLSADCISFDLSNACLGFMNAIDLAARQIDAGMIKQALIVTGENSAPLITQTIKTLNNDLSLTRKTVKKFIANLTIGSAGVAFIIAKEGDLKLECSSSLSDTQSAHMCLGDGNTHGLMMETQSEQLLKAGVALGVNNFKKFLGVAQKNKEDFNLYINHQVGVAHQKLMFDSLGISDADSFITYPKFGNTGSAALPLTLALCPNLKSKSVGMLGIGSGLHSIMMELTC